MPVPYFSDSYVLVNAGNVCVNCQCTVRRAPA